MFDKKKIENRLLSPKTFINPYLLLSQKYFLLAKPLPKMHHHKAPGFTTHISLAYIYISIITYT